MNTVSKHFLFWLLYISFTVAIYYVKEPNLGLHILYEVASLPAKLICVYYTLHVILPLFIFKKKYWLSALQFILVIALCVFLLQLSIMNTVYPKYFPHLNISLANLPITKLISPLLDLIIVSSLAVVVKLLRDREKNEFNRINKDKYNLENELNLLKSQLHPHFLFNTLNGLYANISDNNSRALDMVVKLSDLLRFIIYEGSKPYVSLSAEINSIKSYINLEKVRYHSKLNLQFSVKGSLENKQMPPLLLMPFVENSFIYFPPLLGQ